ncbi:MAG: radical SAM family heme chaperone HemW [Chloroflexota bacterium]
MPARLALSPAVGEPFTDPLDSPLALYVHVPFCERRCIYCDFATFTGAEAQVPAYLQALDQEIARRAETLGRPRAHTVFFGGGTPSLLAPAEVGGVLTTLRRYFALAPDAEVTLETNPGTVDGAALDAMRAAGVNRISFGVQTLHDPTLAVLGRIHSAADALQAFRLARAAGLAEINADLIYGLPGQTMELWQETVTGILDADLPHLSLYALTPERGTPLYRALKRGELRIPISDLVADMYEYARETLAAHGYLHYEISNWARPGHHSRHNLAYWEQTPYLGFGLSAHSYHAGHRTANLRGLDGYVSRIAAGRSPIVQNETVDLARARSDAIILGLRLTRGVDRGAYRARYGADPGDLWGEEIDLLTAQGLLEEDAGCLRLTPAAYMIGNYVWERFL